MEEKKSLPQPETGQLWKLNRETPTGNGEVDRRTSKPLKPEEQNTTEPRGTGGKPQLRPRKGPTKEPWRN